MSVRWPRLLTPTHLSQLIRSQKNPLKAMDIFNEAKTRYPSYRHNGPVYATMIRMLGSSGRLTEMKEIVNQMKRDSCECQDSLFAGIIRTYADAGLFDEAFSLFNSLPEFNCVKYTESFNTLLEIMVKESKLEACYHFFVENCHGWEIKSRTRPLKLLMAALCQIHRSDLALHVFQEMGHQWCYRDRDTYRILMKGLCEDGRYTEATHLLYSMFWRISQKGCGSDVSIYRMLLESLCDNGQAGEAVEVLEKVLLKGLRAPKRYMKQLDLSEFRYRGDVKALINEALIRGGVRSSDGYKAMAIDLYSEGNIAEGDKVLSEMHKKGFKPSLPMYEAKIAALFNAGKVDEAMHVASKEMIENDCVPTVRLHNIVIRGLCSTRESTRAIRYLEKMSRQIGCVPNKETYSYLVDGLCCDGKYVEASQMLEKMLINAHWPGEETYNKIIKGLCLMGETYRAVMLLEEMISQAKIPQLSVWYSLVSSVCCESHRSDDLSVKLDHL
ncbi:pentatricopeptide repeat-containing protein At1g05600 [Salvia miltiorrhiza]|uniref:pentatricopeptide repeat-containing protein At1g05600 n=1 Tax=Salvia miltiorrhiza TaxID=226208 RepID=UPI0025AC5CF6|nr:pentatricopeptide repeat-containing protein At1g05600 [Salvia miltiorrhiza]XP_057787785.1 pentatricopeptide repeat-containing protein At1g05600 [Salvia miltiorrhiza]